MRKVDFKRSGDRLFQINNLKRGIGDKLFQYVTPKDLEMRPRQKLVLN
ncbi:hypothetical protein SR187_8905 [Streptococcus ruminantium]|uniref:Uncharacterized protein n=1 Tax=Streptococcus ruminantium TaxID=1917441 RepID=A0A2Z5TT99_9STRE|nr:hypothetical protein SR187_8905 [Streptococcus ruminantium]